MTEGGKEALALLSLGYVALALTGVNGGYRANNKIGGAVVPLAKPELIDEINWLAVLGRPIVLAFDQDIKQNTRDWVTSALFNRLFRILYAGFTGLKEFSKLSALSYSP